MKSELENIYRYIDKELNEEEIMFFEEKLNSDEELMKMYRQQLKVHNLLLKSPTTNAPADLADSIMNMIFIEKFSKEKYDSFGGLKNIFLGGLTSVIITIAFTYLCSNYLSSTYYSSTFDNYSTNVYNSLEFLSELRVHSSHLIILFVIPILYMIDLMVLKKVFNANTK